MIHFQQVYNVSSRSLSSLSRSLFFTLPPPLRRRTVSPRHTSTGYYSAPLIASVEVFHPITYSRWDNERWGLVMKIVYYPRAVEHKSTVNENTLIFVLYNNIDYMLFVIWISLGIEWKSSTHLTNVIKSSQHKEKFLSRADFPLTGNIFDIA